MSTFPSIEYESPTFTSSLTQVIEPSTEIIGSNCCNNNNNSTNTSTKTETLLQENTVNWSCQIKLHYPNMSILPHQQQQNAAKISVGLVTTSLDADSQQQHLAMPKGRKNRSITHNAILMGMDHNHDVKDDDLTTLVNAALMGYNVTRRRSIAGVPDLFICYPSLQLPSLHLDEKFDHQQQLWILLFEMKIDPSLDLQQALTNFLRRFIKPTSNDQNATVLMNEVLRTTNTSIDPITSKEVNAEHQIDKDHHRQHYYQNTITPTRHNSILISATSTEGVSSTNSLSTEDDSPPAGFIYAPTAVASGSPTKAHDTITNPVHLPHEMLSLPMSLPSSKKNTTDNFSNSRRGSKDSSNSLSNCGLTVDSIIDRLLRPEASHNGDDQIIPIFIIFFRKFMNPHELVLTLFKRFEDDLWMTVLPSPQQQRIVYILATWMTDYWGDFHHHQTREQLDLFIGRLSDFMLSTGSSSMQNVIEKLHPILIRSAPFDDPDDIWGKKYIDDDIQDLSNYNKKKDSGYISSYSGTSPDSPTDDGFRLDDMIWSRHLHTSSSSSSSSSPPPPPPPQDYTGSKSMACHANHSETTKSIPGALHSPDTRPIFSSKTNKPEHPQSSKNIRQMHRVSTAGSQACLTFAGGLICMDAWKSPIYAQRNTKSCLPSSAPVTRTIYSPSYLSATPSFPPSPSFTLSINNNVQRIPQVAPRPIHNSTHKIFSAVKTHSFSTPAKFNTTLLLSLPTQEIAEQLTLIEAELFGKIKSREFVRMIWGSHDNNQQQQKLTSPIPVTKSGLMASISHFNFVSAWVTSMIVTQPKIGKRVALLERFMMIAVALRDLNNYNTLMAILAGISNAAILRLKQTQEGIKKKKIYKRYLSLEKLMSSDRSHCSYRMALKASSRYPCIPYLGIHSQDLIALAEANKDVKTDGTIHWEKFRLMGECIMAVIKKQYQQREYGITPNPMVLSWIAQSHPLTDEEQYKQSMRIEPRLKATSMTRIRDRCLRI